MIAFQRGKLVSNHTNESICAVYCLMSNAQMWSRPSRLRQLLIGMSRPSRRKPYTVRDMLANQGRKDRGINPTTQEHSNPTSGGQRPTEI